MKRMTKIAGIAAAVAIAAAAAYGRKGDSAIEVETVEATLGDITETIPATGKIRPVVQVGIAAEVSGEIVRLDVREGGRVRKGDTLLQVRQDAYISAVKSADASLGMLKADYASHQARDSRARCELARVRKLYEGNAASARELEEAEFNASVSASELESAEYAVRRGEAALREAEDNLSRTVILSPMSGTVSALFVHKGERIVGTSQMAGTVLMHIADLSKLELVADVSENDVAKIKENDEATVIADACRSRDFRGKVTQIANSAKNIAGTFGQVANFEVRIAILSESSLKPGMSATATVTTDIRKDVLTIPAQCVNARDHRESVWTAGRDGKAHSVDIVTGIQDFDRIEVLSGISEGEKVICAPYQAVIRDLREGSAIRVTNGQK